MTTSGAGALEIEIRNSMIYDLGTGSARHAGVLIDDEPVTVRIANTTIIGGEHGVVQIAGTATAINTLVSGQR